MGSHRSRFWRVCAVLLAGMVVFAADASAQPKINGPSRRRVPRKVPPKVEEPQTDEKGFPSAPNENRTFKVDATSKRNEVVFVSKAPKETITGKTKKVVGHIELNPRKLDGAAGGFEVAWADLDTGNKMRNGHLQAKPWVDAASHPKITFTVTGIDVMKKKAGKPFKTLRAKLIGEMSMNGHEKAMKIPVVLSYIPAGENKKGEKVKEGVGMKASFRVALKDFDIKGRGVGQSVAAVERIKVQLFLAHSDGTAEPDQDAKDAEAHSTKKKGKNGDRKGGDDATRSS